MPSARRTEKLNNLLREEISRILDREIEFPEQTLATVTRVRISQDGLYATVFFTTLNESGEDIQNMLDEHVYDIQHILNRRMNMRPVPKIRFVFDTEEMRREQVEKSIAEIKKKGEI